MPKTWQVQQQEANAIAYSFDAGAAGMLVFSYGWEEDPAGIQEGLEAEGTVFTDLGQRTLAGLPFLERELKGPADGGPTWIRQLVASDSGPDGRYMLVQYGVLGSLEPAAFLADFERVLGSLALVTEVPRAQGAPTTAADGAAPPPGLDHEGMARAILKEIMALDDADLSGVETRYLRIIDEYPDTEQAQESYWRLSNLYLQAYDPPHSAEAITLMERYLTRHPDSDYLERRFATFATPGIGLVQKRLLGLYEDAGQWQRALPIYRQLLPDSKGVADERLPYVPGYAAALEAVDHKAEALTWYRLYVDRGADPEDLVVGIARAGVERLSGAAGGPEADGGAAAGAGTPPAKAGADAVAPAATPAVTGPATPAMAPSEAPAPSPEAATLAAEGRDRLSKGDYAGALERFRASVAVKPDPQLQERIKKLDAYLGTAPVGR